MPIKLSKACKELNIGINTAVDFLTKKGNKIDVDPNLRLTDELHLLLVKEFNKDMALKMESERLSHERHQKEKSSTIAIEGYGKPKPVEKPVEKATPKVEEIPVIVPTDHLPVFKQVGHINLDEKLQKPVVENKEVEAVVEVQEVSEVKENKGVEEVREIQQAQINEEEVESIPEIDVMEEPVVEGQTNSGISSVEPMPEIEEPTVVIEIIPMAEVITNVDLVSKTETEKEEKEEEVLIVPKSEESKEPEMKEKVVEDKIYAVKIPLLENKPKVVGMINLDDINASTRPKAKTKEEKKKEREVKHKQVIDSRRNLQPSFKKPVPVAVNPAATSTATSTATTSSEEDKKKKKRERFTSQKVDVEHFPADDKKGMQAKLVKDKFRKPLKTVVNAEEVDKQIKETIARMAGGNKKGKGAKYRREKRDSYSARQHELEEKERQQESVLKLTEFVTVSELAVMMGVSVNQVIGTCMNIGMMVSINQRLDAETINIVADEFGFSTEFVSAGVIEAIGEDEPDTEKDLQPRAPIVTVMGHVDHGKTSLLDYIRKTNVIAGEAGGITQHIGAYNVKLDNGQRITFLDTPGHEAFTAMRARGAKVTDIAIIIVAADDNVMPQTVEAINHASAAGVPMVFAINKVDKPGADPEKIKKTLAEMNYLVEDWQGKYQSQEISAKQGIGITELLEKVLLEAEMLELKANPDKRAMGSVIESSLDKGRGYISTILVQNGTLKLGDVVLAGTYFGKVKAMFNERNQRIKEAKPAEPVLILGLNGAPQAGDNFNVMATEQEAREIANKREQLQREQSLRTKKHFTLDELGRRIALGDFKELNIIVKGDVDGSVEALSDSLLKLSTENIQVNVIHKAVGAISDSDILLAAASNAIICGFQVRPTTSARKLAEKEEIDVRLYSIIYDAIEEIRSAMEGMLSPEIKEEITATVEVREVFRITKVGTVAGCLVREGKIKRTNKVRVIRDGIVIFTGELDSLKRFKEDVKEVGNNYECGLNIKNYNDIQVGDMIESFEQTEVKKTL